MTRDLTIPRRHQTRTRPYRSCHRRRSRSGFIVACIRTPARGPFSTRGFLRPSGDIAFTTRRRSHPRFRRRFEPKTCGCGFRKPYLRTCSFHRGSSRAKDHPAVILFCIIPPPSTPKLIRPVRFASLQTLTHDYSTRTAALPPLVVLADCRRSHVPARLPRRTFLHPRRPFQSTRIAVDQNRPACAVSMGHLGIIVRQQALRGGAAPACLRERRT